jgi:hypothetical protein
MSNSSASEDSEPVFRIDKFKSAGGCTRRISGTSPHFPSVCADAARLCARRPFSYGRAVQGRSTSSRWWNGKTQRHWNQRRRRLRQSIEHRDLTRRNSLPRLGIEADIGNNT